MRHRRALAFAALLVCLFAAGAQGGTYLVLPFENHTRNASLEWMGESFVEGIGDRLVGPHAYVTSRDERAAAFDRLGIPAVNILSRATIIRLAETMDADYVITGQYALTGTTELQVTAQVLEMRPMKLSPRLSEKGPMPQLLEIQDRLGAAIARAYDPEAFSLPGGPPAAPPPATRLDAWENYVRGLIAPTRPQQIKYFREAARLEPGLQRASLQLGKLYFHDRDYSTAALWLSKLKKEESHYLEARFLLGICYFFLEEYEKSEAAFREVASSVPLGEVVNNLGAAQSRRNRRTALDNFRRAAETDPADPDYQFNLGYFAWKTGQYATAVRRLRLALERRPNDAEARALLVKSLEHSGNTAEAAKERDLLAKNPAAVRFTDLGDQIFEGLERIKRNYDEPSFRQLQIALETLTEERLSELPKARHAGVHLERGRELFLAQNDAEALPELQEAAQLDPEHAETHLLLARLHERNSRAAEAIREAEEALRLENSADAHLLLAKIYLQQNKLADARQQASQALQLEPGSVAARSVLKTVELRSP